jgi:hypothetical protein
MDGRGTEAVLSERRHTARTDSCTVVGGGAGKRSQLIRHERSRDRCELRGVGTHGEGSGVAQIEGEITIDRTLDAVFDFVADERNEPRFNPQMTSVDKLSEGEIGLGTQFRAEVVSGGRPLSMVIEFVGFERPHRLGSRTTMSGMVILGELTFEAAGESGTRMRWAWEMHPSGAMRLLKPLVILMGRRQERAIWTSLKRCLEAETSAR